MIVRLNHADGICERMSFDSLLPGPPEIVVEKPGGRRRTFRRTDDYYNRAKVYVEVARP